MIVQLFYNDGRQAGSIDVPDSIIGAAAMVLNYMRENAVSSLNGLVLDDPYPKRSHEYRMTHPPFRYENKWPD